MAPASWFSTPSAAGDMATLASAFALGCLAKQALSYASRLSSSTSSSKTTSVAPAIGAVEHYGYGGKKSSPPPSQDLDDSPRAGLPECPYEYILDIYGRHHFAPFVTALQPDLATSRPAKYSLVLDIMDAVHFALILVDDICDDSAKRKNRTTAHLIYGSCETANRAYFVLTGLINRAMREDAVLGVELLKALEKILEGQDLSLVWRRDGLRAFDYEPDERVAAYKRMAQLKTGTLFVLLGRLLNDGGEQHDDLMTRFGWYAQLQNDCKNIYSDEYSINKGAVAEDLRNGELSFPVVVALNDEEHASPAVRRAFRSHAQRDIDGALAALESPAVKKACLDELEVAGKGLGKMVALWGRREHISSAS